MSESEASNRRHDAWATELAKFTGTEMKVAHRGHAAEFLRANREAVLARTKALSSDTPPALHFDARWGVRNDRTA